MRRPSYVRRSLSVFAALGLVIGIPALTAIAVPAGGVVQAQDAALKGLPITELTEDEAVLHALNRLAYGPRPGDVERVRRGGLRAWIDSQLNPTSIDDTALASRLAPYLTLDRSSAELLVEFPPRPAETGRRPQRIVDELSMAKITRAIDSERQLEAVMTDLWFNHFNVFAGKGAVRWMVTPYEREVIRPRALGRFEDLVLATAKSPAMLFYLDNWLSADPKASANAAGNRKRKRGLNENYARELLELHTLGVDGGYSQQDVTEVARAFTGWTLRAPRMAPAFVFDRRVHAPGDKVVLGKTLRAGGLRDGEAVIAMLARHPSTASVIALKVARRFVSDSPPPALVDRLATSFLASDGDVRAVLATMIESPEFWSRKAYRAKTKTPLELVASTARALDMHADAPLPQALAQWVARIGQPLYMCQPPTGYSDRADAWVNTGALLNRLNFALALAGGRMGGARPGVPSLLGAEAAADPNVALDRAVERFLGREASAETTATLRKQLGHPEVRQATLDDPVSRVDVGVIAGLVLGAPEFQRR